MMILVCCWVPMTNISKVIEDATQTTIHTRGEMIQIIGEKTAAEKAQSVIHALQELIKRGINISTPDVITALNMANKGNLDYFTDMYEEEIIKDRNGKPIRAKMPDKRNILKPSEPMMSFLALDQQEPERRFLPLSWPLRH